MAQILEATQAFWQRNGCILFDFHVHFGWTDDAVWGISLRGALIVRLLICCMRGKVGHTL
jgi:hypothetical protein